jgi:hypothetical protein
MKTKLFTFLLLLIASINYAQDSDIITIDSSGFGNTEEEGEHSAIKNAVKNVFIWKVAADTKLLSDSLDLNYASTTKKIIKSKDNFNSYNNNYSLKVSISLSELKLFALRNNIIISNEYVGEEFVTDFFSGSGISKNDAIQYGATYLLKLLFQKKISTNAKPLIDSLSTDFNKYSKLFYKDLEINNQIEYADSRWELLGIYTISISNLKSFAIRNGCENDILSTKKNYDEIFSQLRKLRAKKDYINLEILSINIIQNHYGISGMEVYNNNLKRNAFSSLLEIYNTDENFLKNPELGFNNLKEYINYISTETIPMVNKILCNKIYDVLLKYKKTNSLLYIETCNVLINRLNDYSLKFFEIPLEELDDRKEITINVTGKGNTIEDAQQKALRSAIEQAFGSFISSKTEILNDKLILDQITSLSNGNIQSFETLEKIELPDKQWAVTLKATVSVNKLISFVESKGVEINIKGDLFAKNIKQQMLNKKAEEISIYQMVGMLHENLQNAFNYSINAKSPESINGDTNKWKIQTWVFVNANKNMETCANYCAKTLTSIGMTKVEIEDYTKLKINYYQVKITVNSTENTIYLRSLTSLKLLESLANNITYYVKQYTVSNGIKDVNGKGIFYEQRNKLEDFKQYSNNVFTGIKFFQFGQECALLYFEDVYSLSEIEKNVKYKITALGTQSAFKEGGYVVYEKDGHGIVMCPFDLDMDRSSCNSISDLACGKKQCESLDLNGYTNWVLPSKTDMKKISSNLWEKLIGLSTPLNSLNSKFMYFTKKDNLVKDEYCKIVKATQGMYNKESIKFYYSDENNFLDGIAKLRPIRVF